MGQNYSPLENGITTFADLYNIINQNCDVIRSQFSGTVQPSNPQVGQPYFNTTDKTLFIWDGNSWIDIASASAAVVALTAEIVASRGSRDSLADRLNESLTVTGTLREDIGIIKSILDEMTARDLEITSARGTAPSVNARLSVALNADGTLKSNAPAGSWWMLDTNVVSKIDDSSFLSTGNVLALYPERRAVAMSTDVTTVYSYVEDASYNSIDGTTTITIQADKVPDGLNKVEVGQPIYNTPRSIDASEMPILSGPTQSYEGNTVEIDITNYVNYQAEAMWLITASKGNISRDGGTINWTLPMIDVPETMELSVRVAEIGVIASTAKFKIDVGVTPFTFSGLSITSPANGDIDVKETPDIVADTATASDGAYLHVATDWYVSTDALGNDVVVSSLVDTVNKNTWKIPKGMLEDTTYYIWRRVHFSNGVLTFYGVGDKNSFTTSLTFNLWPEWTGAVDLLAQNIETLSDSRIDTKSVVLDELTAIVANRDYIADAGYVRLMERVDGVWTPRDKVPFLSGTACIPTGLVKLGETNAFLVYYNYDTTSTHGVEITVVNNTVELGSVVNLTDIPLSASGLVAMDATTVVVMYKNSDNTGRVLPITKNGETWSPGTNYTFSSEADTQPRAITLIDASSFMVMYSYTDNVASKVLTFSGGSFSAGNEIPFGSSGESVTYGALAVLDANSIMAFYCTSGVSGYMSRLRYLTESGGTWTAGDNLTNIVNSKVLFPFIMSPNESTVVLLYLNSTSSAGIGLVATRDDVGVWAGGSEVTVVDGNMRGWGLDQLTDSTALFVFHDVAADYTLKAKELVAG